MSSAGSRPTFHQLDRPGQDKVQAKATASDGRMPAAGAAGPRGRGWAGLALAAASAAAFGTSGTFATSLIGAGWSPAAAVLARIAVAAALLTVPALAQLRGRWVLLRRGAGRIAAYGLVAVAGCQLFYFNAIARMPVGVALLLEYLGPVLVVGWLWARHGQRPRTLTVAGAAASLSGLVLVLNLTGRAHLDPLGVMWGLLAACGLAVYFVLSAHGGRGGRPGADGRHHPGHRPARPPGKLAGLRARAVPGRGGVRLRCRDHRGPAARAEAGLVRRHGRGAVRDPLRVAGARPATHGHAVRRGRVHRGGRHPGPPGRVTAGAGVNDRCSRTWRLILASMAAMPRSRSGLTRSCRPRLAENSPGVARTSAAGRPSSPACRIPAKPRVVGASAGASKNRCTVSSGSTSTARNSGDWHSGTCSSSSRWPAYRSGSPGSSWENSSRSCSRSRPGSPVNSAAISASLGFSTPAVTDCPPG